MYNKGYIGSKKSVRAIGAEEEGKFPASVAGKLLGVSSEAIKNVLTPCEWHHTGKYFNTTDYYDIQIFLDIINNSDELKEYDSEEIEEAKILLKKLKEYKKEKITSRKFIGSIRWTEWGGTRKYPKRYDYELNNIEIEEKGSYYYFVDNNGRQHKKKIDGNWITVEENEVN